MNRVELARLFLYLREAHEANTGLRVEGIQTWCGGEKGESWCCYFVTFILDIEFQGLSPIPRLGACQDVYYLAKRKGWIIAQPEVGCIVLSVDANDHAHHIAFCTSTAPLTSIAGNTSADGVSSNGDRVAEHEISPNGKIYVRVPAK